MNIIDLSKPSAQLLFREGVNYKKVDPKRNNGLKYATTEAILVETGIVGYRVALKDHHLTTVEGVVAQLSSDGSLIIYEGAMWDGPSGPTFDTIATMLVSLIHDIFYYFMWAGLLLWSLIKEQADRLLQSVLYLAMIARLPELKEKYVTMKLIPNKVWTGFSKVRAGLWYQAVHWFGGRKGKGGRG